MRNWWYFAFIVCFFSNGTFAATTDSFQLWTEKDQVVDVVAHYPFVKDAAPAIILLPGQSYHKDLRLLKDFALKAVKAGFVVLRFDWSFFYNKEKSPSKNLEREEADFAAVLKFARESQRIRQDRIYLVGKSLGSIVATKAFLKHKSIRALTLLTPVMKAREQGERFYGGMLSENRQMLVIHGAQDKFAPYAMVQAFFAPNENVELYSLPGNHSLNMGKDFGQTGIEFSRKNIQLAIDNMLHWIEFNHLFL